MPDVILASQSPQRKTIMETLGIPFEVLPADIDEQAIKANDHKQRAQLIAQAKAQAVSRQRPDAVILACDTFTVDVATATAFEKPADVEEAKRMLRAQSGKELMAYTGVCYLDQIDDFEESTTIETSCAFRELSDEEIEHFVMNEPVTTWSAAFCPAYPSSAALLSEVSGSLTSFTHGFPVEFFVPLLQKSGVRE